ncbi:MAG: hypothetical protein V7K60_18150 [Nostoc sp.]
MSKASNSHLLASAKAGDRIFAVTIRKAAEKLRCFNSSKWENFSLRHTSSDDCKRYDRNSNRLLCTE